MPDFSMTRYFHEYQGAVTRLSRIGDRLKTLKEKPLYVSEEALPEVYAEIEAAEAEYAAAQKEADDLWCKANAGMSLKELEQSRGIRWKDPYGGFHAHRPPTPKFGGTPH